MNAWACLSVFISFATKTIKLVHVDSLLITQHLRARAKTGWLGITLLILCCKIVSLLFTVLVFNVFNTVLSVWIVINNLSKLHWFPLYHYSNKLLRMNDTCTIMQKNYRISSFIKIHELNILSELFISQPC